MDACNSEKLSDLNMEPLMTLKEAFPTVFLI